MIEDSMAGLIDKIRKTGQQAQMTGNQQQGQYAANAALTPFYDAALGRRNENRKIDQDILNSNRNYDLAVKSQADSIAYNNAALAQAGARDAYTRDQNAKNEKFQWIGAGTTLATAAANTAAAYYGNQSTQKKIDAINKQNALPTPASTNTGFQFDVTPRGYSSDAPMGYRSNYENFTPPSGNNSAPSTDWTFGETPTMEAPSYQSPSWLSKLWSNLGF